MECVVPYEGTYMTTDPGSGAPVLPGVAPRLPDAPEPGGNPVGGGCLTVLALIVEIPVALLIGLSLGMRGWAQSTRQKMESPGHVGPPPMDWVPVLWLGAFTLAVFVVAGLFLRSGHPLAGSVQLLVGALVLAATIATGTAEHERAHPAPLPQCPTQAGVPCAPQDPGAPPANDRGSQGHQCRSGGDSDECADSGR